MVYRTIAVVLALGAGLAWGAAGDPDPTFGTGGLVTTSVGTSAWAEALVQQSDGKLVVAGGVDGPPPEPDAALLVRYLPDGRLDPGFGSGGIVRQRAQWLWGLMRFSRLLLQPDDGLIAVGQAWGLAGSDLVLARYGADGAIDTGFGMAGVLPFDVFGQYDHLADAVRQDDGRIVLAANSGGVGSPRAAVVRRLADGTADPSFGVGGIAELPAALGEYEIRDLLIEPDGRIVVAVASPISPQPGPKPALIALDAGGVIDAHFGVDGLARVDVALRFPGLTRVVRLPDGRLVAAGYGWELPPGEDRRGFLARFMPDGSPDPGFGGGDGVVAWGSRDGLLHVGDLLLAPGGRLLGVGWSRLFWGAWDDVDLGVAAFREDGTPDPTWGHGGETAIATGGIMIPKRRRRSSMRVRVPSWSPGSGAVVRADVNGSFSPGSVVTRRRARRMRTVICASAAGVAGCARTVRGRPASGRRQA